MEQEIKLLIINPGSTSTKISIFENGVERYKKSLSHPASEVARYASCLLYTSDAADE